MLHQKQKHWFQNLEKENQQVVAGFLVVEVVQEKQHPMRLVNLVNSLGLEY